MSDPILDDTDMDKMYHELGGHETNSRTLTKSEQELMKEIDKALDSVEKSQKS